MNHKNLTRKSAIITGASRGIGAATATYLAGNGMKVLLAARSKSQIENIASTLRANGYIAEAMACDVSRYSEVENLTRFCKEQFGSLDLLVNNAGVIDPITHLSESDPDEWGKIVDINFKGVYHGLRAAIPVMQKQNEGTIINISSGAATGALEGWSHYCSTKAAVLSLTRCTDKEYREQGVRVVGLSPGTVATDMQVKIKESGINPVSNLDFSSHISPEDVAQAIGYLAGEGASKHLGTDFSLKTEEGRIEAGLTPHTT